MATTIPAAASTDRMIAVFDCGGGSGGGTAPSGWTRVYDSNEYLTIYEKIGSDAGGTTNFTQDASGGFACQVFLIAGAHASTAFEYGTQATGNDAAPNSGSLSPAGGSQDYLWLAVNMHGHLFGTTRTVSTFPSGYTSTTPADYRPSFAQCLVAVGYKASTASSEDPGAFALSGAIQVWRAITLAVSPAAAAATASRRMLMGVG